jgi:lysosomal-associated membrane protein 1/2
MVPQEAAVSGTCNYDFHSKTQNGDQQMELSFSNGQGDWKLSLEFSDSKNKTLQDDGKQYMLYEISVEHKGKSGKLERQGNDSVRGVYASKADSYKCSADYSYWLNDGLSTVDIADAQLQAYTNNATGYGDARTCPADRKTNDLVPIIVGACLAALVVIVLIAYLIGRARAKRSTGYESV